MESSLSFRMENTLFNEEVRTMKDRHKKTLKGLLHMTLIGYGVTIVVGTLKEMFKGDS